MERLVTSIEQFADYLKLTEMGEALGIHPQSVRRLIKTGRIKGAFEYAGMYLIHRDDLAEFKQDYNPKPGRKPIRRLL